MVPIGAPSRPDAVVLKDRLVTDYGMKKLTFAVVAFVALNNNAMAADVSTFDIGGVKLGMTPSDAKSALQAKCKRDLGRFDVTSVMTPNPYLPGKQYAQYMHCKTPVTETTVSFLAIPSGAVVVHRVIYTMPWSVENVKSLKESALAKYGEPTNIVQMDNEPEWCNEPSPTWKGGPVCKDSRGPSLLVVRAELQLADPRYQQQVWDDQKAKQTAKPSL